MDIERGTALSKKKRSFFTLVLLFGIILPASIYASSGDETGGWGWIETIGKWINLAIVAGALVYFLKGPVTRFFGSRKKSIQQEILEALKAQEEAENRLAEMEARIQNLDAELEAIRIQAHEEAELERKRIIEDGKREAVKIKETAL